MDCGIYRIVNTINDKFYLGSSKSIRKRKNNHLATLRKNKHHCAHLQAAFRLYGEKVFSFETIELTSDLQNREQYYLDLYKGTDRLYNSFYQAYSVQGQEHPMFGKTHTDQAKTLIKQARARQKIKHSDDTKRKISLGNQNKSIPYSHILTMIEARSNKPVWNKGLTAATSESVKKYADKNLKKLDATAVLTAYTRGASVNELARIFDCSWSAIKNVLKKHNTVTRNISEQKKLYDKTRKDKQCLTIL